MKNRKIRIVVLGDQGVGKTSWVSSIASINQQDKLEKVLGPIYIPPELCLQQFDATTIVVDTQSIYNDQLEQEIKQGDVILLFYDVAKQDTVVNLKKFWLPKIQHLKKNLPVVVIGNKSDLFDDNQVNAQSQIEQNRIKKVIVPLIKEFNFVEMGLECSALHENNIKDIIFCAQRAVLFPISPLYQFSTRNITEQFEMALARIFRIIDKDEDGYLNDTELADFQLEVFRGELTQQDILGIKNIIKEETKQSISDKGISFVEFKILQKKCLELLKIQICWTILRYYGYDDNLQINKDLLKDELLYNPALGQSVELKELPIKFLVKIFQKYQKDQLLQNDTQQQIFFPIKSNPFQNQFKCVEQINNGIKLTEWIGLWNQLSYDNYQESYKYLKYIGYDQSLNDTFQVTNKKNCYHELKKTNQRNVFTVDLIGIKDEGKEDILRKLINCQNKETQINKIIKTFQEGQNKFKTYIFKIMDNQNNLKNEKISDVAGIVFRNEGTIEKFLQDNLNSISKYIPKIVLKTNSNQLKQINSKDVQQIPKFCINLTQNYGEILNDYTNLQVMFNSIKLVVEKPSLGLQTETIVEMKSKDAFFIRQRIKLQILGGTIGALLLYYIMKKKIIGRQQSHDYY